MAGVISQVAMFVFFNSVLFPFMNCLHEYDLTSVRPASPCARRPGSSWESLRLVRSSFSRFVLVRDRAWNSPNNWRRYKLDILRWNDFIGMSYFEFDTWLGEIRVRPRSTCWRRINPWTKREGGRCAIWLRRRLKVEILLLSFKAMKIASIWVFDTSDK